MCEYTEKRFGVLYELINRVNGKGYAGKDSNPTFHKDGSVTSHRLEQHFKQAHTAKKRRQRIHDAIREFGESAFYIIVHPDPIPVEDLAAAERALIAKRDYKNPKRGFNMTVGGEGSIAGWRHRPDSRAKMSAASRGRKHSPEARAKISAAQRGKECSPETRAKIGASNRGRKHSPEARAKISAAQRGRKFSPETRAKMSASQRGRKHTPETRAKISAGHGKHRAANIGRAIAMRRDGMSMQAIADDIGVNSSTITRWIQWHRANSLQTNSEQPVSAQG